jgi:hypothetical protein
MGEILTFLRKYFVAAKGSFTRLSTRRKMQKVGLPKASLEESQPGARTACATWPSLDSPLGFGFE